MNPALYIPPHLSSAEDFFQHFDLPFDAAVVNVNRLHILKRFKQYLAHASAEDTARSLLQRAYGDFVHSSAQAQKVFKLFSPGTTQGIAVSALRGSRLNS